VHRSNFRITGFTSEVSIQELARLGQLERSPGSRCRQRLLIDLQSHGLHGEPLVKDSVAAGAMAVFSGDKLLGGPQAESSSGPRLS